MTKLSELSASRWFWISVGTVLAWIWLLPLFPTQDGPMHVYQARMMLDAGPLKPLMEWSAWHLPQWSSQLLTAAAIRVLDVDAAYRVIESLAILSFPLVLWRLHARHDPQGTGALVALLWMMGLGFSMGFWAFLIGLAAVPVAERWYEQGRLQALALLLLAGYYTHPLPWLAACLVVMMGAVRSRRWWTLWVLVPSGWIAAWHVASTAVSGYYLPGVAPAWTAIVSGGFLMMAGRYPFELARAVMMTLVGAGLVVAAWRQRQMTRSGWLAGLCLGAAFVVPDALFGGTMVRVRVAMIAGAAAITWLAKTSTPQAVARWLAPAMAFMILLTCADRYRLTKAMEPLRRDVENGVAQVASPWLIALPAKMNRDSFTREQRLYYLPMLHVADLAAARLGIALLYQQPAACGTFPLRWMPGKNPDSVVFGGHPPAGVDQLRWPMELGIGAGNVLVWDGDGAPPRSKAVWKSSDGLATLYALR